MFAACLAVLRFLPHRMLIATLLLAGWGWAIPFRGNTEHEFEAMFRLGVPLVFWSLALLGLRRTAGSRRAALALPAAALAAAAVFAVSAWDMGRAGLGAEAAQRQRDMAADFRAMRPFTTGHTVSFPPGIVRARYWLAGYWAPHGYDYDYVVLPANLGGSLTPDNRLFHLYGPAALDDGWAALTAREPAASSRFDVYLDPSGRTLTYAREGCAATDTEARFFVHAYAAASGDLPEDRREAGFEARSFLHRDTGLRFAPLTPSGSRHGRCLAQIELPEYAIARVVTGQYDASGRLWEAEIALGRHP